MLAGLIVTTCAACVPSNEPAPSPQSIPPAASAGDLFKAVPVPEVHEGDDAKVALAKTRAALALANRRIEGGGRWVDGLRGAPD